MILRFLFTRSEVRGTLFLVGGVLGIRILLAATAHNLPEMASQGTGGAGSDTLQVRKAPARIELNSADSIQLLDLPGIGPVFAKRILKYRTSLGGFVSARQLLEVYGMDTARLNGLKERIRIDTSRLVKLDLNQATFKELLGHPYLEYEHVLSVCRFRDRKGRFESAGEIWAAGVLPDSLRRRITPYLTVKKDSIQNQSVRFGK